MRNNENTPKRKNDKRSYFCLRTNSFLTEEDARARFITDPNSEPVRNEPERIKAGWDDVSPGREAVTGYDGQDGDIDLTDPYYFRCGCSASTEEEKQLRWSKATVEQRDWWKAQSVPSGIYDGLSNEFHERHRRSRIKQLGNSVVPAIPQLIGEMILMREAIECL